MADQTAAGLFVVRGDAVGLHVVQHASDDRGIARIAQTALRLRNDAVRVHGVIASRGKAGLIGADGQLGLVAVIPGILGREDGLQGHFGDPADALQGIFHFLLFIAQLRRIGQMHQLTPAAASEYRARCFDAVRRRRQDLLQSGKCHILFCFHHACPDGISRQRPFHEKRKAIDLSDAFPF